MKQLQQIISRIQSGELTRENDVRDSSGFYDFLLFNEGYVFPKVFNLIWDLYETMEQRTNKLENKLIKITELSEQLDEIISQE